MKGDINEQHKWSPKNRTVLDTDDWEVAFMGGGGGGGVAAGGALSFWFRSRSLKQYLRFLFVGGGPGAGLLGSLAQDTSIVEFDCSRIDWLSMKEAIAEPFSTSNLCDATGRVSILSVATPSPHPRLPIGVGYNMLIITAEYEGPKRQGLLFDEFHFSGFGPGTSGLGAGVFYGKWVFLGLPRPTDLDSNWTMPICN